MAISWDTQISDVNTATYRADVTFTRTDDTGAEDPFVVTYGDVILETQGQRAALLDQVWGQWQVEKANRSAIATFIGNLEQTANSNLDGREV